MKKLTLIIGLCLIICLVSCDADSILRTGKFLSKTNKAVLGSSVTNEKVEDVKQIVKDFAEDTATAAEGGDPALKVVNLVQQIKNSPSLLTEFEKELDKKVENVDETKYNAGKAVVSAAEKVFGMASDIDNKIDDIVGIAEAVKVCDTPEKVSKAISKALFGSDSAVDLSGYFSNDATRQTIVGLCTTLAEGKGQEQTLIQKFNEKVAPFKDLINDLAAAGDSMVATLPKESSDVTNRGLINEIVTDKIISDVIDCGIAVLTSEGNDEALDAVVACASALLADLDTISVINPGVSFSSLDSLLANLMGKGE